MVWWSSGLVVLYVHNSPSSYEIPMLFSSCFGFPEGNEKGSQSNADAIPVAVSSL